MGGDDGGGQVVNVDVLLARLWGVKKTSSGWQAKCPAHDDRKASLSIAMAESGKILVHCHAGCATRNVLSAAGLTFGDLAPEGGGQKRSAGKSAKGSRAAIVKEYDYRDRSGNLAYQVCRMEPKDFRQRRPDGNGGWTWSLDGVRRVLYRLPELVGANPAEPVFLVEGEKDADNLAAVGLIATTNAGGAGKWGDEYAAELAGRHVVILPDNDEAGRRHAHKVAASLHAKAASVRIVELPNLPAKGDVSDWLAAGGTADRLRELAAETKEYEPAEDTPASPKEADDDPHRLARIFLAQDHSHADGPTLRYWHGEWYAWCESAYQRIQPEEIRAGIIRTCKREFDAINVKRKDDATAAKVTKTLTGNVLDALASLSIVPGSIEPPAWLGDGPAPFPLHECVFAANGIVHLPSYFAGKNYMAPPTPLLFSTTSLGCGFDLKAPEPVQWLRFLDELWPNDPAAIATLQEWFGYVLTTDTSQQKILLIVGPKRSGKGTIARVLTGLVGRDNVAGPTLSSLATNFGLWPLIGKSLAIISDARLSGRTDASTVLERLLAISGEDSITIDRKNLSPVTVRLQARFTLLSNEIPRFTDASGALASRFIPLVLTQSFLGREDLQLEQKLLSELPGILLWAIEGWRRLQNRGHFAPPDSGSQAMMALEELASPVGQFVEEYCVIGPGETALARDVYIAWTHWCTKNGHDRPGDAAQFGRDLRTVVPTLRVLSRRDADGSRHRWYQCLGLSPRGQGGTRWYACQPNARDANKIFTVNTKEKENISSKRNGVVRVPSRTTDPDNAQPIGSIGPPSSRLLVRGPRLSANYCSAREIPADATEYQHGSSWRPIPEHWRA